MLTVIVMLLLVALSPGYGIGYRHLRVKPLDIDEPGNSSGDDAVGGGRDVERRVHRQGDDCGHGRAPSDKGYWAASGAPAACCSASCTTAIVCKMLAALTLIELIPSRARNCAISG